MFPRARYKHQQLHGVPRPEPGAPGRLGQARSRPPPARGMAALPPGAGGASPRSQKKEKDKKKKRKKTPNQKNKPSQRKKDLKAKKMKTPFFFFSLLLFACYPAPSPLAESSPRPAAPEGGGRGDRGCRGWGGKRRVGIARHPFENTFASLGGGERPSSGVCSFLCLHSV